jgi:NAD(P)-dependent dehydrogenase (short-subunit alcohol dehydrogenase family)
MELDGTRVMVTGASTGIGRVTALRLARRGALVWAAARDERRLEELAAEHSGIVPAPADVSDDADRAALVKQCEPVDVPATPFEHPRQDALGEVDGRRLAGHGRGHAA